MADVGKILLLAGIALAMLGAVLVALGKMGFRRLPGDMSYESPNVRIYFPIVMCLVLSALLTLGIWVWRWMSGR